MNDLTVFDRDGQLYTDSRQVAKMIGKDHKHLLRDIDGYVGVLSQSPKLGPDNFFKKSSYKAGTGKTYPCYLITKKGCEFVANKLTGEKGIIFTAAYVNAFHYMEDKLSGKLPGRPSATNTGLKQRLLSSVNHEAELLRKSFEAAGIDPKFTAVHLANLYRTEAGQNIPALPIEAEITYDRTEIAKRLGVMTKSGNPHSDAIGAIIRKVGVDKGQIIHSSFSQNGHDGGYDRFKAPVLEKVREWLDSAGWPNPIKLDKKYSVVYKERH